MKPKPFSQARPADDDGADTGRPEETSSLEAGGAQPRENLETEIRQLRREFEALKAGRGRPDEPAEDRGDEVQRLTRANQDLQSELAKTQVELERELTRRSEERKLSVSERETLERTATELRTEIEVLNRLHQEHAQQQQAERERLMADLEELRNRAQSTDETRAVTRGQIEGELRGDLEKEFEERLARAEAVNRDLTDQLARAQRISQMREEKLEAANAQVRMLSRQFADKMDAEQSAKDQMVSQLSALRAEVEALTGQHEVERAQHKRVREDLEYDLQRARGIKPKKGYAGRRAFRRSLLVYSSLIVALLAIAWLVAQNMEKWFDFN